MSILKDTQVKKSHSPFPMNENKIKVRDLRVQFHRLDCPTGLSHWQNCCWRRLGDMQREGGVCVPQELKEYAG